VAERVVDLLEPVEIEQHHAKRGVLGDDQLIEVRTHGTAVQQTGQGVVIGLVLKLLLQLDNPRYGLVEHLTESTGRPL
jgi:hypothetical protein